MPQTDIIDNRHERLIDHIQTTLETTASAKFAVGYFFVSGLEGVAKQLAKVHELKLLIGTTTSHETIEQMAEGYRRLARVEEILDQQRYAKRSEMQRMTHETGRHISEALALMDQTDSTAEVVATLAQMIAEQRLHVRVYTKGRLHAKAYIFTYGQVFDAQGHPVSRAEVGTAIVGSSNFTLSGIQQNTELNVVVPGNNNHAVLNQWFDTLWDESVDFDAALMQELQHSWALAPIKPYDLYFKTLLTLVQDRVEGGSSEIWTNEIFDRLADFQKVAVRQAVQIMRDYGGCFVADVVGLGKSYIGAAIARHFVASENARPLIICPAPLVAMWERYNEVYQLNARVLSMGYLRNVEQSPSFLLNDVLYRDRNVIIVDESHNFRNPDTQRYKVLQSFLATGRKVCLLTATPRNKTAWDIYHQIKLFHPDEMTDLPITPPNLKEYFVQAEAGKASLPALLSHILIRRTRNHILRWYGYDALTHQPVDPTNFVEYLNGTRRAYVAVANRQQFFPQRHLETITYSIEDTYRGLYQEIRGALSTPQETTTARENQSLTFARYGLWRYVDTARQKKEPYASLKRAGANLHGLIRILLFKRFESSVVAFRKSIQRLIAIHERFLEALGQGVVPAGEEAQGLLYEASESDEDDLTQLIADLERATARKGYQAAAFDLPRLQRDITHDLAVLRHIANLVAPITPDQDAKLQCLKARLAQAPLLGQKRLIFTQYVDTARYLYEQLNPGGTRTDIAVIASNDRDKTKLVARFAPKANPETYQRGESEIQTLIATDVLSEGLNLQDGNCLINYDLHWNPVRLIQRFGRIDRIGSEHDAVYGFNFLPELGIEQHLGLRGKLQRRIQEIHDTIGEDAAILDNSERLNEQALYAIYEQQPDDLAMLEDDEDAVTLDMSEAEEIIRKLREDDPTEYGRIAALKDGIRTARHSGRSGQEGVVVLCKAGTYQQLLLADHTGNIISRDTSRILGLLKCEPTEKGLTLPDGYNRLVSTLFTVFTNEIQQRQMERAHTVALTMGQRYILQALRSYSVIAPEEDREAIGVLSKAFRLRITAALNKQVNQLRLARVRDRDLYQTLLALYEQHSLRNYEQGHADTEEPPMPLIVCSEALVW